jgi:hypothetical protein
MPCTNNTAKWNGIARSALGLGVYRDPSLREAFSVYDWRIIIAAYLHGMGIGANVPRNSFHLGIIEEFSLGDSISRLPRHAVALRLFPRRFQGAPRGSTGSVCS